MATTNSLKTVSRKKVHAAELERLGRTEQKPENLAGSLKRLYWLDFLGEPINFHYKGSTSYESPIGCCCSLFVVISWIIYLSWGISAIRTNVTSMTASVEVRGQPEFHLFDQYYFRLAMQKDGTHYLPPDLSNTLPVTDFLSVAFERVQVKDDGVPQR